MSTIPDPARLVALAQATQRKIVDREWKQYQRYLSKFERHGDCNEKSPLSFDEFCTRFGAKGNNGHRLES